VPLFWASRNGHVKVVSLLIAKGSQVNIATDQGSTPLSTACGFAHEEVVKLLIENGADVNTANNNGATPLRLVVTSYFIYFA
jgi:uncharacterized protein